MKGCGCFVGGYSFYLGVVCYNIMKGVVVVWEGTHCGLSQYYEGCGHFI